VVLYVKIVFFFDISDIVTGVRGPALCSSYLGIHLFSYERKLGFICVV